MSRAVTLNANLFPVREHTLKNGLRIRLQPDHQLPTVTYSTFFRVGSRNERPGISGIAHLFEHMMFNGAAKYGPKEFDRVLESHGGYSNAFTSHDLTAYYEEFASAALPKVVDLESDRMRSLAITPETLKQERQVVMEERRLHVDNQIFGMLDEQLAACMWLAHPYRWPIIGWMGDIEGIRREQCQEFFRTFYAPNNAVVFVVGDFDSAEALALIEEHYADIPAGPALPEVATYEPQQRGERRAEVHFPAQSSALMIGYHAPKATDERTPALDVLQFALSAGEGALLNRELVYRDEVAVSAAADFGWRLDPGAFVILAELPPGVAPAKAEAAIDRLLNGACSIAVSRADEDGARQEPAALAERSPRWPRTRGRAHAYGDAEVGAAGRLARRLDHARTLPRRDRGAGPRRCQRHPRCAAPQRGHLGTGRRSLSRRTRVLANPTLVCVRPCCSACTETRTTSLPNGLEALGTGLAPAAYRSRWLALSCGRAPPDDPRGREGLASTSSLSSSVEERAARAGRGHRRGDRAGGRRPRRRRRPEDSTRDCGQRSLGAPRCRPRGDGGGAGDPSLVPRARGRAGA